MKTGIITVAFGAEYDELAARTMCYSRKYTNLPIHVLGNCKNKSSKWNELSNYTYEYFNLSQDENRDIKTRMFEFSPFEKTLFIDCDCIVQNKGCEDIFQLIPQNGILVNLYSRWREKIPCGLYKKHFEILNITTPIEIYYGAFLGFDKSDWCKLFFREWNQCWIKTGKGREMPSLAAACQITNIKRKILTNFDIAFTWKPRHHFIIQHEFNGIVKEKVGFYSFKAYKPFDNKGGNL